MGMGVLLNIMIRFRHIPLILAAALLPTALQADPLPPWQDYHIAMWQKHPRPALQALQSIGVDAATVYAKSGEVDVAHLRDVQRAGDRFYLENLATDIFSPYHMASSSAYFAEIRALHATEPGDMHVFERQPSLADKDVLMRLWQRLGKVVASMKTTPPLFYNLADEAGVAETGWAWDYDISPPALAYFRRWVQIQYPSLEALNAQWGSKFASWDDVTPMLTDPALRQSDGNYSGWGDFKQWTDDMFAAALQVGTEALHHADPNAISAIEGAQIPGWGGYDFTRLARAVDLMEIYEYGHNIEIARAINPNLIVITTSFNATAEEHHRLWHEVLLGARGHVIWDENNDFATDNGTLGASAQANAATYRALRGGIPTQFIASQPMPAEVAILASMPSYRIEWLLARRGEKTNWALRNIDDDYAETPWRRALDRAASGLAHLGVPATYLSPEMLAGGVPETIRLLILPKTMALSDREADAIHAFLRRGGAVVADGVPGAYDGHLRLRKNPALQDVAAQIANGDFLQFADPQNVADKLSPVLERAGVAPAFSLTTPDGKAVRNVTARLWRNGAVTLIGLERDLVGVGKDAAVATGPERLVVSLAVPASVSELQTHVALGGGQRFTLSLDPVVPSVLTLSPGKVPTISVDKATQSFGDIVVSVSTAGNPAVAPALHVDVLDAAGQVLGMRNLVLHNGAAEDRFAAPDGAAKLRIVDVLSGAISERPL